MPFSAGIQPEFTVVAIHVAAMEMPKKNQRLWCLLSALDRRVWRRPPKGTGLKTANTALEFGLILARGNLKQRRYRLTAVGAEVTKRHVDQHKTGQ